MEGLARAAGSGVPIKFKGETIILPPLTLGDLGTIEQHILAERPNPLDLVKDVIKDLPADLAKDLLDKAYKDAKRTRSATAEEVAEYLDTLSGLAFSFWVALQKKYGDRFKLEEVYEIMAAMDEKELEKMRQARDQASGLDERGNSTGQTRAKEAAAAVPGGSSSGT